MIKNRVVEEGVCELYMVKNEGMNPISRLENPRTTKAIIILQCKNLM
jgi:hypothetical protein